MSSFHFVLLFCRQATTNLVRIIVRVATSGFSRMISFNIIRGLAFVFYHRHHFHFGLLFSLKVHFSLHLLFFVSSVRFFSGLLKLQFNFFLQVDFETHCSIHCLADPPSLAFALITIFLSSLFSLLLSYDLIIFQSFYTYTRYTFLNKPTVFDAHLSCSFTNHSPSLRIDITCFSSLFLLRL